MLVCQIYGVKSSKLFLYFAIILWLSSHILSLVIPYVIMYFSGHICHLFMANDY